MGAAYIAECPLKGFWQAAESHLIGQARPPAAPSANGANHQRIAAPLPAFKAGALHAEVRGYQGLTPYARWGNWPAVTTALLVVALALVAGRRRG